MTMRERKLAVLARAAIPRSLAIVVALNLVCCARAFANETVQACGSYLNNVFAARSVPGIGAFGRCPAPSYVVGGLGLSTTGSSRRNQSSEWRATAPPGLELVGATANQIASAGVNAGQIGGGFFWAGGSVPTTDTTPNTVGMVFPTPSSYFGMHLICLASSCTQSAALSVEGFDLYAQETIPPTLVAPTGLWQANGWVRGSWPVFAWGDSASGLCSLSASLNGAVISAITSVRDVSTWHQCAAPPISQTVTTAQYGQGPVPLTLSALDAAGVPASITKTVYVDNSTPTLTLSGPVDAPSTAGTQYVTASAGGSPSGIAAIVCSVDGGAAQSFAGPTAQLPVDGIGPHNVSCYAANNAVDPAGAHGTSPTSSWSLKIGQPTELGVAFDRLVGLRCHRAVVPVKVPGHWITVRRGGERVKVRTHAHTKLERVMRCHPKTVLRRTFVVVRLRRHGHIVKVTRTKWVRVVVPPHWVANRSRTVAFGHSTTVDGWLGTSNGTALAGQLVHVLAAPNNGTSAFREVATATTTATGAWHAKLTPGPSRLIEAVFGGSPTTEASSSAQVKVLVPAEVLITIKPRIVPWGSTIRISGRVLGGYVPASSKLLRLNVGIGRIGHIQGLPNIQPDGRFVIIWKFDAGRGVLHPWFSVATLPEAAYPYTPGTSPQVTITLGNPTPRPVAKHKRHRRRPTRRRT